MSDKIIAPVVVDEIYSEVRDYELAIKVFEHLADKGFFKKLDCYCCTCPDNGWDPACNNHGAHGIRGCEKHRVKPEDCNCGCDFKVSSV